MTSETFIPTFFKVDLCRSTEVPVGLEEPVWENWQLNQRV